MRQIFVSGKKDAGKIILVDDEDFQYFSQFKWYLNHKGYAQRNQRDLERKTNKSVVMHKEVARMCGVIGLPDHINGNKLDNRKCNFRGVTHSQNAMNKKPQWNARSQYKGVSWRGEKDRGAKWRARIMVENKSINLGSFRTDAEAALAYNAAAIKYHGEYARLNEVRA